jgi:DnaJ family protein A protein 5
MADFVLPDWARSEEQGVDEDEESSESEIESFECVACNKQFKSQKQFEAHERSKKHLKAVKQLCRDMRMENVELDLEPTVSATISPDPDSTPLDAPSDEDNDDHLADSPTTIQPEPLRETIDSDSKDQLSEEDSPVSDDQDKKPSSQDSQPRRDSLDSVDEDYASRESVETRLRSDLDSSLSNDPITPLTEQLSSADLGDESPVPQVGKAKQRRAKKAARTSEQSTGISCTNCQATFTSKTKLFAHLKDNPGHAQLLKATAKSKKR